uniref:hypothetical protein n=1 Tax=Cryobacterium sp. Y62 TaxID=2048284 RepID=UPI001E553F09
LGALQSDPAALLPTDTAGRYIEAAVIGLDATSATTRRAFKTAIRRQAPEDVNFYESVSVGGH